MFVFIIVGLVLSFLFVGVWVFLGLIMSIVIKIFSFLIVFYVFINEVIWLIVIFFFFVWGFVKIGLGDSIVNYFVKWLGKSILGLFYGLMLSEVLIVFVMLSIIVSVGGVFLFIIKLLLLLVGSEFNDFFVSKLGFYFV